jgi:6-pyruvoyltetrahydropterin/6-carboxytetrahydropterin synthase
MITCTRRLEFDAAHRVMNHESKCATLHGHRYVIEITAEAEQLDSLGRIIDFSVLKAKVGTWMDREWDHTAIIYCEDEQTIQGLHNVPGFKPIFLSEFNPTAENMAEYLLKVICPRELEGTGVRVSRVRVYETPNCYADATL